MPSGDHSMSSAPALHAFLPRLTRHSLFPLLLPSAAVAESVTICLAKLLGVQLAFAVLASPGRKKDSGQKVVSS